MSKPITRTLLRKRKQLLRESRISGDKSLGRKLSKIKGRLESTRSGRRTPKAVIF